MRQWWYVLFVVVLAVDLAYSGYQYYHQPLDGDVSWNVVPAPEVTQVLRHPSGVKAWWTPTTYPNPNRFFCHWSLRQYLLVVPLLLQAVVDPVSSVYLAAAIAKLVTHLSLLYLLARLVTGRRHGRLALLGVMALLTPLFQAAGYRSYMGIVDPSVTYTFFYALPTALTLLFLLPFADHLLHKRPWRGDWRRLVLLTLLALVLHLSGPLNPGIVLVLSATYLLHVFVRRGVAGTVSSLRALPPSLLLLWSWGMVLAGYSLFLGQYNSLATVTQVPLAEVYGRLPEGLYRQFFQKLGFPLLFIGLAINYLLLGFGKNGSLRWRHHYGWILIFCALYVLLLPLGGYREYRPYSLRYDTILPVTLSLLWLYGSGVLGVWQRIHRPVFGSLRFAYPVLLLGIGLIFANADRGDTAAFDCEVATLRTANFTAPDTVFLRTDCPVMSWGVPVDASTAADNRTLLRHWNIID